MKRLFVAVLVMVLVLLFSGCSYKRDHTTQIKQAEKEQIEDPLSYYIENSISIAWDYLKESELISPEEVENLSFPRSVYLVRIAEINGYTVASYVGTERETIFFYIQQVGGKYDLNTNVLWIEDTPIDIGDKFSRYLQNENTENRVNHDSILREVLECN